MISFPIIRVVTKLIIPYILLFGFYVQFHGDFGPGGGFQAGVILASAFILYGLVFGLRAVKMVMPPKVIEKLIALGVLIYAGTGVATMLLGQPVGGGHAGHHASHVEQGLAGHHDDEHGDVGHHNDDHVDHEHDAVKHEPVKTAAAARTYANFLDYDALDHHFLPGILPHGQHLGIFLIEVGVGMTVTAVMTMIFYCFAGRHSQSEDDFPSNRGGSGPVDAHSHRQSKPNKRSNADANSSQPTPEANA